MRESITWFKLWQRIGNQPLRDTRGKKVEFLMNGVKYEVALVFTHNGRKWHLEPTKVIEDNDEHFKSCLIIDEWAFDEQLQKKLDWWKEKLKEHKGEHDEKGNQFYNRERSTESR